MKALSFLNPQSWLRQVILLVLIAAIGYTYGLYVGTKRCPPVTQVQIDQKNKVKKGSQMANSITGIESQDCEEWLRALKNSEIKKIRKK